METFSALLALVWGIHWWPVNSPHKVQWRFLCLNKRLSKQTGDWSRHRVHYDVTVMCRVYSYQCACWCPGTWDICRYKASQKPPERAFIGNDSKISENIIYKPVATQLMCLNEPKLGLDRDASDIISWFQTRSGTHFTNHFSITIQIRWKIHLALIQ